MIWFLIEINDHLIVNLSQVNYRILFQMLTALTKTKLLLKLLEKNIKTKNNELAGKNCIPKTDGRTKTSLPAGLRDAGPQVCRRDLGESDLSTCLFYLPAAINYRL